MEQEGRDMCILELLFNPVFRPTIFFLSFFSIYSQPRRKKEENGKREIGAGFPYFDLFACY